MRSYRDIVAAGLVITVLFGCGGSDVGEASNTTAASSVADERPVAPAAAPGSAPVRQAGIAQVVLTIGADTTRGDFPASLCGGPFLMGQGVAYQTRAGEWQITVASETRQQGDVALNTPAGDVSVVVTANGAGRQLVRGPRNGGTFRIADDFRRAEADLELRGLADGSPAHLMATFTCDPAT